MTPFSPLLIIMIVRLIFIIAKTSNDSTCIQNNFYKPAKRRYKMNFRFRRKINSLNMLFNGHYLDAKALYVLRNGKIPCIRFIGEIDCTKALDYIREIFAADVKHKYHHSYFDHDKKDSFYNSIILVMPNERMIEVAGNYCHLLHNDDDFEWATRMCEALAAFRNIALAGTTTQVVGFTRQPEIINN